MSLSDSEHDNSPCSRDPTARSSVELGDAQPHGGDSRVADDTAKHAKLDADLVRGCQRIQRFSCDWPMTRRERKDWVIIMAPDIPDEPEESSLLKWIKKIEQASSGNKNKRRAKQEIYAEIRGVASQSHTLKLQNSRLKDAKDAAKAFSPRSSVAAPLQLLGRPWVGSLEVAGRSFLGRVEVRDG